MKLVPQNINEAIKHLKGKSIEEINKAIDDALENDDPINTMVFLIDNDLLDRISTHKLEPVIKKIENLENATKFKDHFLSVHTDFYLLIINLENYHAFLVGLYAAKEVVNALYKLL